MSLVRYALHQDNELVPYPQKVEANFRAWVAQQEQRGRVFSEEQLAWLMEIKDAIAADMEVTRDTFEVSPFVQMGGLGKIYQVFGEELDDILGELNEVLVA